jgi:hypothetical protein
LFEAYFLKKPDSQLKETLPEDFMWRKKKPTISAGNRTNDLSWEQVAKFSF